MPRSSQYDQLRSEPRHFHASFNFMRPLIKIVLMLAVLFLGIKILADLIIQWQSPPIASGIFATQPIWVYRSSEPIISTPTGTGDLAYVRTTKGVYALNRENGQVQWRVESSGSGLDTHFPQVFEDILVVPESGYGSIAVYSAQTGELQWRTSAKYDYESVDSIAYSQDTLVVARYDEYVTAYDVNNGSIKWRVDIPGRSYTEVITNRNKLYSDIEGNINIYDMISGKQLSSEGNYLVGRMAFGNNILYVVLGSGADTTIGAINLDTHSFVWKSKFPAPGATVFTYLTLDGNTLYITGSSIAAMSTADGQILWQDTPVTSFLVKWDGIYGMLGRPIISGNTVYVVAGDSRLYAFDRTTGAEIGILSLHGRSGQSFGAELNPGAVGDLLLIPVDSYTLSAYRF